VKNNSARSLPQVVRELTEEQNRERMAELVNELTALLESAESEERSEQEK
jgi:hypothetical protein